MKYPIDPIPFSDEARARISTSLANYQRHARVYFTFAVAGTVLSVHVQQSEPAPNGRVLTQDELIERAKGVFEGLMPEGYSYYITAKALDQ